MPAELKAEIQGAIEKIAIPVLNGTGIEPGAGEQRQARARQRHDLPGRDLARIPGAEMKPPPDASRRLFLRHAGAMGALLGPVAAPLALNLAALGTASAQAAPDYKALVCLFLFGGNDAFNMVLPTDTSSWANYSAVRNQAPDSIALLAPGTAPT